MLASGFIVKSRNKLSSMKTSRIPSRFLTLLTLVAAVVCAAPSCKADFLYWGDGPLKTGSIPHAYDFASNPLRLEKATNIQRQPLEVTGSIGRTYVAIHCVSTSPRVTAVVMVVGPDGAEAMRVRDAVRNRIMGMVRFDE
jgi:hypothetical protein